MVGVDGIKLGPSSRTSRMEPSMSVRRNVTVPVGRGRPDVSTASQVAGG